MKTNKHIDFSYEKMAGFLNNEPEFGFVNEDITHTNDYKDCMKTWKQLEEMKDIEEFDSNKAWNKLHTRFTNEDMVPTKKGRVVSMKWISSIAATILILISVSVLWQSQTNKDLVKIVNISDQIKVVNLNDGSVITLNKDATLFFPKQFNSKSRNVKLVGEAFFNIARNPEKPFIIDANNAKVTVLGTSFNVKTLENNNLEVVVKTGKVEVCDCKASGNNIILVKGESGQLQYGKLEKTEIVNANYLSWMNKKLVFKAAPLTAVVTDINNAYHTNIQIGDTAISSMLITTTFDNLNINELLNSIALTLNINVKHKGKNHILVLQ